MNAPAHVVDSPDNYTPSFCEATRAACETAMHRMREDIKKIDNRFFTLIILGIGQLLTVAGALSYFILTRVDLVQKVHAVQNVLTP